MPLALVWVANHALIEDDAQMSYEGWGSTDFAPDQVVHARNSLLFVNRKLRREQAMLNR